MKALTEKQVKLVWIAVIAVIALIVRYVPDAVLSMVQAAVQHGHSATVSKSAAASPQPLPSLPTAEDQPPFPPEARARFLGVWDGQQMGNSNCQIHLELRASPYRPGYIAGYETRICYDLAKFMAHRTPQGGLADALRAKSPLATELEGTFFEGDLNFRVANSIGGSEYTCPLSSYSVLPWGTQDVVAQWKASGQCADGQMVLKRGRGEP